MATALKLGPADHGRRLTVEEFFGGDYDPGYKYELIDGRLEVSPLPNPPENHVEDWILDKLKDYSRARPEVVNFVTNKARVYVAGRDDVSYPEPDVAAYRDYPRDQRFSLRWEDVSPILVVEVLDPDDPQKDLVRNAEVYLAIPSIKEYWVFDTRPGAGQPTLKAHRRHGKQWRIKDVPAGEMYTTRLLPDFELVIDPTR
jgi:Uma2 family endonuclease